MAQFEAQIELKHERYDLALELLEKQAQLGKANWRKAAVARKAMVDL